MVDGVVVIPFTRTIRLSRITPTLSVARKSTKRLEFDPRGMVTVEDPTEVQRTVAGVGAGLMTGSYTPTAIPWIVGPVKSAIGWFKRGIQNASQLKKYLAPWAIPSRP